MITPPRALAAVSRVGEEEVGSWQVTIVCGMLRGEGGLAANGGRMMGLCRMTGLVLAGRPGELCGRGGCEGLDVGAGRMGGLCDRGRLRITLVPPPSKTPLSSRRLLTLSTVGSGGWI